MFNPFYVVLGLLLFAAFFALQLWACRHGMSRSVRLMPFMLTLIALFLCLMLYSGAFGMSENTIEGFNESELNALVYGFVALFAFLGTVAARIFHRITTKKSTPKTKNKKKK